MRKSILYACLVTAIAFAVFSCSKEQNLINEQQIRQDIQNALQQIQTVQKVDMDIKTRIAAKIIVVDGGSNNALAQALKDAGEGGIVYLRNGLHTETSGIVISSKATLIGETGAILKVKSLASLMNLSNGVTEVYPAIHVLNAPQTIVMNLEILPADKDGSTAILFENASFGASINCTIKSFMFSIMVEGSNQTTIMDNKIIGSTLWQANPGLMAGVINSSGVGTWIANNDIEMAGVGIFASDQKGYALKNKLRKGHKGVILCHLVPKTIKLPNNRYTGGEFTTSYWQITDNQSDDNVQFGFLIVDGSFNNTLEGNTTSGNGIYDIHLTMKGTKFAPTPTTDASHDNIVKANATQKVKDCGERNIITGVKLIDTTIDPCN
jgi:nitrous oxidase accessory protein NosD